MAPAHRKNKNRSRVFPRRRVGVVGGSAVVVAGLIVGVAACGAVPNAGARSATGSGSGNPSGSSGTSTTAPSTTTTTVPLTVASVTPAPSAALATDGAITIDFSAPLASPVQPTLTPPVAGHWSQSGRTLTFHPTGGYIPSTHEVVTVPQGIKAVEGGQSVALSSSYKLSYHVATGTYLRLQELLSELHYLPFTFQPSGQASTAAFVTEAGSTPPSSPSTSTTPSTTAPSTTSTTAAPTTTTTAPALQREPTQADAISTSPVPGTLSWAYPNIPHDLAAAWSPGKANVLTKGAVMAFEADNGLAVDGIPGIQVWQTLLRDVAARKVDPHPYNFLMVNETGTEYLKIWSAGKFVYTTLANTGVPGAVTAPGIYPVYLRYSHQIMRGTDVNGTKYAVPVSWISYFNGGDAVHGYPRASYGYPQSNGCVELPISNADMMWNSSQGYDGYGVLVDVSSGPLGS